MTSDERREVAAKLRERERGWRKMATHVNVMQDRPATQFEDIAALLGFNGWILDADIFARLADLIDPTCHVSDEEVTHQPTLDAMAVHVYTCDRCNSPFYMGDVCMHPKPLYCPYCGARVVRDDDQR